VYKLVAKLKLRVEFLGRGSDPLPQSCGGPGQRPAVKRFSCILKMTFHDSKCKTVDRSQNETGVTKCDPTTKFWEKSTPLDCTVPTVPSCEQSAVQLMHS